MQAVAVAASYHSKDCRAAVSRGINAAVRRRIAPWFVALVLAGAGLALPLRPAHAADKDVARGKYLVSINGCNDCHTPGYFFGKPDMTKYLGGSDVGFAIPGLGVFVGPNLTSDKETGLGNWTTAQIVTALTKGETPDGRILVPIMPWRALAHLTPADAQAIAVYLKSLPPVQHKVAGPFGPSQTPTVAVMSVQPGDVYARLVNPPPPPAPPPPASAAPPAPAQSSAPPPASPAPDTK